MSQVLTELALFRNGLMNVVFRSSHDEQGERAKSKEQEQSRMFEQQSPWRSSQLSRSISPKFGSKEGIAFVADKLKVKASDAGPRSHVALVKSLQRDFVPRSHGQCKARPKQLPEAAVNVSVRSSVMFAQESERVEETRKVRFRLVGLYVRVAFVAMIGHEFAERVKRERAFLALSQQ